VGLDVTRWDCAQFLQIVATCRPRPVTHLLVIVVGDA
jgi:hypothetical protein